MSGDIKNEKKTINRPLNELSADESEELCKRVIESSNDGIVIVRGDKSLFCNRKYLEMSGYERAEEAADKPYYASVHPDDRDMVTENVLRSQRGEQTSSRYEFRIIGRKGSIIHVEASSTAIVYGGEPASLSFIRDITEQKHIEEVLQERAERFHLLADAAFEGIVIHDRGEILDCNQAMFEMFGYEPEEVIGKSVMRFILPESRELIMRHIETGSDNPYEIKMSKQDGTILTMEVVEETIPFKGRIAKIAALRDITDRKAVEKALWESEQRFADIIQFLPDATFVIDREGKVIAWNRAIEDMTGVKGLDIIGKGDYEYTIPFYGVRRPILIDLLFLSDPEIEARYDFVNKKGNTYFVEVFIQTMYDGKGAYLWATASKLFDRDGNIAGAVESIRDITEKKRTEKALKESEDKYRSIFENAIEGIFQTTPDGRFLSANPAFARMYGFESPEEMVNSVIDTRNQMYVNPEDRTKLKRLYQKYGRVSNFETQLYRRDMTAVWVSINARAVRDIDGNIIYYEGTIEDITERKRAEEKLIESERSLLGILSASPIGIGRIRNRVFDWVNDAMCCITGYTLEGLKGQNTRILFESDEEYERVGEVIYKAGQIETVFVTKDGATRHAFVQVSPTDSYSFIFTVTDITRQKEAESRLKESEQKYRALFENAIEGIFQTTPEGRYISVNPALAKLFGYDSPRELMEQITDIGRQHYVNPEDRETYKNTLEAEGVIKGFEVQLLNKDGNPVWTSISARVVKSHRGAIIYYEGTVEDITERKTAEDVIRDRERLFTLTLDDMVTFVALLKPDGEIIFVNNTPLKVIGKSIEQVRGMKFYDVDWWAYSNDIQQLIKEDVERCASGKNIFREVQIRTLDGYMWIDFSIHSIFGEDGNILYLIPEGRDVTERKQAEERLKTSLMEKEILLKEIHHRVKNNMQVISSLLNMQSRYLTDAKTIEMFKASKDRIKSMALVHDKLYHSESLAQIDFADYVRNLASSLMSTYSIGMGITLETYLDPLSLNIDTAIPCGLIINELVSNSLKHAFPEEMFNVRGSTFEVREPAKITITLKEKQDQKTLAVAHRTLAKQVVLTIADNGIGFPDDIDFTCTESLGMQLVVTLVEQLDGTVELHKGGGTGFSIVFREVE